MLNEKHSVEKYSTKKKYYFRFNIYIIYCVGINLNKVKYLNSIYKIWIIGMNRLNKIQPICILYILYTWCSTMIYSFKYTIDKRKWVLNYVFLKQLFLFFELYIGNLKSCSLLKKTFIFLK